MSWLLSESVNEGHVVIEVPRRDLKLHFWAPMLDSSHSYISGSQLGAILLPRDI